MYFSVLYFSIPSDNGFTKTPRMANTSSGGDPEALCAEVEDIRGKVKAGQQASLEDAETGCRQVCAAAEHACSVAQDLPPCPGVVRITQRLMAPRWDQKKQKQGLSKIIKK